MSCCKPKCRNKSDDPMVSCWLCDAVYHAKCVDLAARTVDNLKEDKGLRWCCKKCIAYDIEFYSFFKKTHHQFNEINNDLINVLKKCTEYKHLLEKKPFSPKKKNSDNDLLNTNISENPPDKNKKTVSESTSDRSSETVISNVVPASSGIEYVQERFVSHVNNIPLNLTPVGNIPLNTTSVHNINLQQYTNPPLINIDNCSHNTISPHNIISPNNLVSTHDFPSPTSLTSLNHNPLRAIPPKKAVFVSRLAYETSTEDVNWFIKSKIGLNAEISTRKFNYSQPREISSFKVVVPDQYFNTLLDPSFWPINTFVREFTARQYNGTTARLPLRNTNISKN